MRTLAIGDIHGCLRAFDSLLALVDPQPDDRVVTLGDYVDRGPDSKSVLDRLIELRLRCRVVNLLGNHDLMMLAACEDVGHFEEWIRCGGKQALESYGAKEDWETFDKAIPKEHWQFLRERCMPFHETKSHFFVHANVQADLPLDQQPDYMLFWETLHAANWRQHESGKTMICGHSAQRSGRPLVLEGAVCIDTKAYANGWLTCLNVKSEEYWQANQDGETRSGSLGFPDR